MRDTEDIYREVPPDQRERLFTFRATHAYHEVTVNGATWRYLACGRWERALLFLPGAFLKADVWFNQILSLEEDYRIIAPDAYALQGVSDLDVVCDALLRSQDAEGIERATVIGIAAGRGVAPVLLQHREDDVYAVPAQRPREAASALSPSKDGATRRRRTSRLPLLLGCLHHCP